jgi:hypothetical protein
MPRNGSGTFTLVYDWTTDEAALTPITASRFDTQEGDIASEISNSVAKDGQTTMTGNLKMGSSRITGMADGTALTDAATVKQVQNNSAAYATTTGSANAYVLTLTPAVTALTAGQRFTFKASFANTGAATLNVNSLGATSIKKLGSTDLASGDIANGEVVTVVYDGTNFQIPIATTELVRDTSPQLGGDLEANSNDILMQDNYIIRAILKDTAEEVVIANSGTTYNIDLEQGNIFVITLTANCTFTFSNPPATGKAGGFILILIQDATGGRSTTFPTVKWTDAVTPTLTTTANSRDILGFITTTAGSRWDGFLAGVNMS